MIWRVILLWWLGAMGSLAYSDTQAWDAWGRLHAITERDATNSGYNWTAVYDPLARRLSTTGILVTNGYAFTAQSNTINQYYDPQADCLELGVTYGTKAIWKLYGPDLDGVYGGLNGRGGFDGFTTSLGLFLPTICDARGNVLGYITNGTTVVWNPSRPTAYGAVPGYRPVALGNGANVPQSSGWDSLWSEITGCYNFHHRIYDPITCHWLSGDPSPNEGDPNNYTFNAGDPVNNTDPDGSLSAQNYNNNPGQGLGSDNGAQNVYFGVAAQTTSYVQTTTYFRNAPPLVTGPGTPGNAAIFDPSDVTGYSYDQKTVQTGQAYFYKSAAPAPENLGQAGSENITADIKIQQYNQAIAGLAMVPTILDGGALLLDSGGAVAAQGSIDYGALDALGRPTGVNATITQNMIGTGTVANSSIIPPGWSGNGILFNEARGHLLGAQLGGSGDVVENLVTLQQNPANSPIMRGFENQVRTAVENGQTVNYSAIPIYDGANLVPKGITIMGTGSGDFNIGVTILNPVGK